MEETRYRFKENYFDYQRGRPVSERILRIFLRNTPDLWKTYCSKMGEPSGTSYLGLCEYSSPDHNKVISGFLEDLVGSGIIKKVWRGPGGSKNE